MKIAYLVKIDWRNEFRFDDMTDAGVFAAQAANHRTDDNDDCRITIELIDLDKEDADD